MRMELKRAGKRFGLGLLDLAIALGLFFAAAGVARGRVPTFWLSIIAAAIFATVYLAGGRWIERCGLTEFKGTGGLKEFAGGVGLGLLLFSAVMALLWAAGAYHPTGWQMTSAMGSGVIGVLAGAILEEVLFRGFLFRLVEVVAGTWWAVVLTSALFGVAHVFNPGASVASSAAVAIEAGVLLGAAYALTGRLWFPIGLHAAWNFAEGYVIGMTVSGFEAKKAMISGTLEGPAILTGGVFGPEASVIAVVVCFSAALIILWRMVRSGRVQPPAWRLRGAEGNSEIDRS
jgi:membrane protease YdiL (CAAX protease family)